MCLTVFLQENFIERPTEILVHHLTICHYFYDMSVLKEYYDKVKSRFGMQGGACFFYILGSAIGLEFVL